MIEAIALIYYAVTVCGATNTLAYWLVTSLFAWILMGLFTRGRNEDLEELLRNGKEEEKVECCAPFQDPAALAAAQRPSVRRSKSGHRLEMCASEEGGKSVDVLAMQESTLREVVFCGEPLGPAGAAIAARQARALGLQEGHKCMLHDFTFKLFIRADVLVRVLSASPSLQALLTATPPEAGDM